MLPLGVAGGDCILHLAVWCETRDADRVQRQVHVTAGLNFLFRIAVQKSPLKNMSATGQKEHQPGQRRMLFHTLDLARRHRQDTICYRVEYCPHDTYHNRVMGNRKRGDYEGQLTKNHDREGNGIQCTHPVGYITQHTATRSEGDFDAIQYPKVGS